MKKLTSPSFSLALAMRILRGEKNWNHDAFFDYEDRWMYEDDAAFVKTLKEATGKDYDKEWARHGWAWQEKEAFVKEMWTKHRPTLAAPTDGWKTATSAMTPPAIPTIRMPLPAPLARLLRVATVSVSATLESTSVAERPMIWLTRSFLTVL
jgi:hypothetical protein